SRGVAISIGGFTIIDGFRFVIGSQHNNRSYLKCASFRSRCRARAILINGTGVVRMRHSGHNHTRVEPVKRFYLKE
ncbi:hypothetical protein KR067_012846, partial [Drosophila pandora]